MTTSVTTILTTAKETASLVGLPPAAMGQLMPFFLWLSPTAHVCAAGPTLHKLIPDGLVGARFLDLFDLRRPGGINTPAALAAVAGQRLHLALRTEPFTEFRGQALVLPGGQGFAVNLAFGIDLAQAVASHELTARDFAPTDHTVEMLYLAEAKAAVADELAWLNRRLRAAKSTAEDQALTDPLTGLRNRRALDAGLARATASGKPFGLMHVDMDFFKQVNDRRGHAAGDHALQHVARILSEQTRTGDLAARVGGDEFVVLFADVGQSARLDAIAGRILARLAEPVSFNGTPWHISASIGTTCSTHYTALDLDRMLADADAALYTSKRAGGGRATAWPGELPSPHQG